MTQYPLCQDNLNKHMGDFIGYYCFWDNLHAELVHYAWSKVDQFSRPETELKVEFVNLFWNSASYLNWFVTLHNVALICVFLRITFASKDFQKVGKLTFAALFLLILEWLFVVVWGFYAPGTGKEECSGYYALTWRLDEYDSFWFNSALNEFENVP